MDKVIEVLNKMIELCEPIKYEDFNKVLKAKDVKALRDYEQVENTVGLARYNTEDEGISTLSIIATITDILIDERLVFIVADDGYITGVKFYER